MMPGDISSLQQLEVVDICSRESPVVLSNLPNLKDLTLRQLRPSCRRSHDPERVSTKLN